MIELSKLIEIYNNVDLIPYVDLLKTFDWHKKRNEILSRDKLSCQMCNNTRTYPVVFPQAKTNLQVHHKKYIIGKRPWDYDNEDLITLCNWCHHDLHKSHRIPTYEMMQDGSLIRAGNYIECTRCEGEGYLPEYSHVDNGVCFKCHGQRYLKFKKNRKAIPYDLMS